MALTSNDQANVQTLVNAASGTNSWCIGQHAVAPGMGESSVPAQIAKALAYWQALSTTGLDSTHVAAINDAITYLTAQLAWVKNPSTAAVNPYDRT